ANEPSIWRVIGAVDGTALSYSAGVGGPATIDQGQRVDFITGEPFVISSQDADHPFMLFNLMAGSQWANQPGLSGRGDADFVISVPPAQYLRNYVFFADPTYPTTNLVLVRRRTAGQFHDVTLDCAGVLGGWAALGTDYEWTRFNLIDGDFQANGMCSTGSHQISSDGYFGLWVWGWGTPDTGIFTQNVSYGYPGGMNVAPINEVVIPPVG
ncbi:MAG: IgGFc-binding protein, partial [Myxococcales bacterium]|nr:IgGFc-binding protein [Myxococcales bacterium]